MLLIFAMAMFTAVFSRVEAYNNETIPNGLVWNNLSVQTSDGTYLLQECHGFVPNGQVCGLLGPSGAGKSTTLSSLSGAISSSTGLQVSGEVLYCDSDKHTTEHLSIQGGHIAWLRQKDNFFSMLTVQETLDLAAFLELPHLTKRQRAMRVATTLNSLGLTKLKNRMVGDSTMHERLSGGERRRLSLALELIASPKLFIGDEPTSGLDSTLSEKVIRLIRNLVKQRNIPCILSLHQPRSSIWRMLDSIILMAPGGRVCYMGGTKEAVKYFSNLGYECPHETNPAEFLLDLVSIDSEDPNAAEEDEARIAKLAKSFAKSQQSSKTLLVPTKATFIDSKDTGGVKPLQRFFSLRFFQRFGRLLQRSLRQNIRNHRVNILRLLASAGNAYLFTNIFKSIKKGIFTCKSVADRTAMLTFGIINMSMMALMKTIDLFAKEKPVVQREQQRCQYSSLEYLMSKSLAEIPLDTVFAGIFTSVLKLVSGVRIGWIELTGTFALMTVTGAAMGFAIGALSPTAEVAMSAGVPIMVILMTVGVINPSGVDSSNPPPAIVGVLKQLSPIAFAVKAVCLAEYRGMEFEDPLGPSQNLFSRGRGFLRDLPKMGALAFVKNGDQVLQELGLGEDTYTGAMRHLAILSAANLLMSWIGLRMQSCSTN